tara:strand:+ start:4728 stop:4991 length:264 start_codon:yes stop_codon:yes gene_type:complete
MVFTEEQKREKNRLRSIKFRKNNPDKYKSDQKKTYHKNAEDRKAYQRLYDKSKGYTDRARKYNKERHYFIKYVDVMSEYILEIESYY